MGQGVLGASLNTATKSLPPSLSCSHVLRVIGWCGGSGFPRGRSEKTRTFLPSKFYDYEREAERNGNRFVSGEEESLTYLRWKGLSGYVLACTHACVPVSYHVLMGLRNPHSPRPSLSTGTTPPSLKPERSDGLAHRTLQIYFPRCSIAN